jgi:divalent metal cation (Fe/Co/Zn/Cd) transporter
VEVASDVNVNISHDIIDNIEHDFRHELNIELVIHMDPIDTKDQMTLELKDKVKVILETIDPNISFHDFRVVKGITHINLIFDVVIPPKFEMSPDEVDKLITKKIKAYDKRFNAIITVDQSYGLNLSREN